MTPKARLVAALILPLAVLSTAPLADEVTDQLDTARKAYEAGELRSAVQALNFAAARVQERINDQILKLLPEPLEGWEAEPAQSQSGGIAAMVAGTMMGRTYRRPDGAEVELHLMADSPMMAMMTIMMQTPMLMQASQDTRVYTNRGYQGMMQHEGGSNEWEISLMVGNRILVQAKGRGLADKKPVEDYLNALDLSAVQKALTN
jgi:hypothetical protein